MRGSTVLIYRPLDAGIDSHGNAIYSDDIETVDDVLINKPSTDDMRDSAALTNGVEASYSLAFPVTYTKSLRGCSVVMPCIDAEKRWRVIGDPRPIPHNLPHRLNR